MNNVFAPLHERFQVCYPSEKTFNYIFKAMLNLVINNLAAAHTGNIFSCPTLAIA